MICVGELAVICMGDGCCDLLWDDALSHLCGVQTRVDPAKNRRCYYNRATKQVCSVGWEGGSGSDICMGGKATVS